MKRRVALKAKTPPRRPAKQYEGANPSAARAPAVRIPDQRAQAVVPVEKHDYVRSKPLMAAYRELRCQGWLCGRDDGTVCGAHSNWAIHGKGRSIKAGDDRCASLCHDCHTALDQGKALNERQKQRMWWLAHVSTVKELVRRGLWPKGVPVPDVEHFPEQWA